LPLLARIAKALVIFITVVSPAPSETTDNWDSRRRRASWRAGHLFHAGLVGGADRHQVARLFEPQRIVCGPALPPEKLRKHLLPSETDWKHAERPVDDDAAGVMPLSSAAE
jgi:hypothetical protein